MRDATVSGNNSVHHPQIRDDLGDEDLHPEATQQKAAEYRIVLYAGGILPSELRNLVLSRWLKSLRYGNDYFKLVNAQDYYVSYGRYLEASLKRSHIRFAVLADNVDVVLGFSVTRGNILDYVHVHRDQRRQGIGRALVPVDIDTCTHLTKTGLLLWGNKTKWKFNPFI